jgi:hypothetical protein
MITMITVIMGMGITTMTTTIMTVLIVAMKRVSCPLLTHTKCDLNSVFVLFVNDLGSDWHVGALLE